LLTGWLGNTIGAENLDDAFDRQRCLFGWQQARIASQHALVLGVGAVGCTVALTLARLGVRRITLLDNDTVCRTNLNRQVLFAARDVGKRKVDVARRALLEQHVPEPAHTTVAAHHADALDEWQRIVALARDATVIFINIDVGVRFDYAVASLAQRLGVPYVAGSSYGTQFTVECCMNGNGGDGDEDDEKKKKQEETTVSLRPGNVAPALLAPLRPSRICTIGAEMRQLCPRDAPSCRMIGSNALVVLPAGVLTVNHWAQQLMMMSPANNNAAAAAAAAAAALPNFYSADLFSIGGDNATTASSE
jgi:molybdopterin/thiamine biosynthesis adenylyltransferase